MARGFVHPAPKDFRLDAVLHALSDSIRRAIVSKLMTCKKEGMSCSTTCNNLSPSTISFHYKVLRDSGLITSRKVGVTVLNQLRLEEMNQRFPGLVSSVMKHDLKA